MKITAQEEYGLRCALQLARVGVEGSLTIPEIGEREGLSTAYVGKLLHLLRQADLVRSVRGRSGGYTLSRPAEQVSVSDVIAVLGSQTWDTGGCSRFSGMLEVCVSSPRCTIRSLWGVLDSVVEHVLRSITLADLLSGTLHVAPWLPPAIPQDHGPAGVQRVAAGAGSQAGSAPGSTAEPAPAGSLEARNGPEVPDLESSRKHHDPVRAIAAEYVSKLDGEES